MKNISFHILKRIFNMNKCTLLITILNIRKKKLRLKFVNIKQLLLFITGLDRLRTFKNITNTSSEYNYNTVALTLEGCDLSWLQLTSKTKVMISDMFRLHFYFTWSTLNMLTSPHATMKLVADSKIYLLVKDTKWIWNIIF